MESNWCTTSYFYKPKQKNSIRNVFPRFGGIVYFVSVHNAHIQSVNALIIDQPCWIGHAAFPEYSRLESCGPALLLERLPLHKLCGGFKIQAVPTQMNKGAPLLVLEVSGGAQFRRREICIMQLLHLPQIQTVPSPTTPAHTQCWAQSRPSKKARTHSSVRFSLFAC